MPTYHLTNLPTSYFPPTILNTYIPTYLRTSYFPPTILHTYLPHTSHLPSYIPTYLILPTYHPTYLPTYLPTLYFPLAILNTYIPTYFIFPTYHPTYLPTYVPRTSHLPSYIFTGNKYNWVVPLGTTSRNFQEWSLFFFQKIIFSYFYFYFFLLAHSWNSSCLPNFRMTWRFCKSSLANVEALQQMFLLLKELDLVMFGSPILLNNTNIKEVQNPIVGTINIFNLLRCELSIFFYMHIKFV